MRFIFFLKMFRTSKCPDFKNGKDNSEKDFCFLYNCFRIGCIKLSLLRIEYSALTVNMLTNSPKIFHMTKRDFFQLNCLHIDQ